MEFQSAGLRTIGVAVEFIAAALTFCGGCSGPPCCPDGQGSADSPQVQIIEVSSYTITVRNPGVPEPLEYTTPPADFNIVTGIISAAIAKSGVLAVIEANASIVATTSIGATHFAKQRTIPGARDVAWSNAGDRLAVLIVDRETSSSSIALLNSQLETLATHAVPAVPSGIPYDKISWSANDDRIVASTGSGSMTLRFADGHTAALDVGPAFFVSQSTLIAGRRSAVPPLTMNPSLNVVRVELDDDGSVISECDIGTMSGLAGGDPANGIVAAYAPQSPIGLPKGANPVIYIDANGCRVGDSGNVAVSGAVAIRVVP